MVGGQPNNKEGLAVLAFALIGATLVLTFVFTALKDPLLIALEVVIIAFTFISGLLLGRATRHEQDVESRRLELQAWTEGRQELAQMYNGALRLITAMMDRATGLPTPPRAQPQIGFKVISPNYAVSEDKLDQDATMVYNTLYNKGTHPTQSVLTGLWPDLFRDHNYMTQVLDYLADRYGVVTRGVKGKERTWIYDTGAGDPEPDGQDGEEFDEFARR